MSTLVRIAVLALVVLALPCATAEPKRTLAGAEFQTASALAEEVLAGFAQRDWDALRALMADEYAEQWTDETVQQLDWAHEQLLGPVKRMMLADAIVEVSPGCHEWQQAVAYEEHDATLSFQLCGSGRAWAMQHIEFAPSVDAVALLVLRGVIRRMEHPGPWDYTCEGTEDVPIGGSITCWITKLDDRETIRLTLERKGAAHLVVAAAEVVATTPEATRDLLEPLALRIADRVARGRYQDVLRDAAPTFAKGIDADRLGAMLSPLATVRGPVSGTEWVSMATRNDAPIVDVTLKQVHADSTHVLRLAFVPDRGQWRLFGVDPDTEEDAASMLAAGRAVIESFMRKLTGDPDATIDCPWDELAAGDRDTVCRGVAFGQRVRMVTEPGEGSTTQVTLTSDDLLITVSSLIARLERVLGWRATHVECDAQLPRTGETTQCRVASPQGNRVLTVRRKGQGWTVVDNARQ